MCSYELPTVGEYGQSASFLSFAQCFVDQKLCSCVLVGTDRGSLSALILNGQTISDIRDINCPSSCAPTVFVVSLDESFDVATKQAGKSTKRQYCHVTSDAVYIISQSKDSDRTDLCSRTIPPELGQIVVAGYSEISSYQRLIKVHLI
jgi:hypothetical protein